MGDQLRDRLEVTPDVLDAINGLLLDPGSRVVNDFLAVVEKYGTPEEINRKAQEARKLPNLIARLRKVKPSYVADLEWLIEQRDREAFVSIADYRREVLGDRADGMTFNQDFAVTLEISALQYFPFLITEARQAVERGELMPGRFIRVRKMKEQEADGDLLAVAAAMQIVGASYMETLDTKGTDGSNIHLGGPETITGYFGGVGQPNEHALQWLDEFLYYYTTLYNRVAGLGSRQRKMGGIISISWGNVGRIGNPTYSCPYFLRRYKLSLFVVIYLTLPKKGQKEQAQAGCRRYVGHKTARN